MKKLLLFVALAISSMAMAQKGPFAPVGSNWKYWFADEYSSGYIQVTVVKDTVLRGAIAGTEDTIDVNCSMILNPRASFSYASLTATEIPAVEDMSTSSAKYMFREGNKAYIYDPYNFTFYKLIDMDAEPGDTWAMSTFNGKHNNGGYSHTVFHQDPEDGVPEELLPYFNAYKSIRFITKENWACNLDYEPFVDSLLNYGITQEQIDTWQSTYTCNSTASAIDPGTDEGWLYVYNTITAALTENSISWTEDTWACDFAYNYYYGDLTTTVVKSTTRDSALLACDTDLNYMTPSAELPEEIEALWETDVSLNNYNFRIVTKYDWPAYMKYIQPELIKTVEAGGLGLTAAEVKATYSDYAEYVYEEILIPSDVDSVQVVEIRTVEIDGVDVKTIHLGPACHSALDEDALQSEVTVYGALNIDYLNTYSLPWPVNIGESGSTYEILYFGLICGSNGTLDFATETLEEYFETALPTKYEANEVSCAEMEAPKFGLDLKSSPADLKRQATTNALFNQKAAGNIVATPEETLVVNTVVHVVHHPDFPDTKIPESLVQEMIDSINAAFTANNNQSAIHPNFSSVVGNPGIELQLTNLDPDGETTTGIVYHETSDTIYTVGSGDDIQHQYAFKFDDIGRPYAWDHTQYLNIFIADLGGRIGRDVGGFVTNPETSTNDAAYERYLNWLESNDTEYWSNWLDDSEGDAPYLDGLSVDYFATFYSEDVSADLIYKTAIHELGHYFGLRHTFGILVEVEDGVDYSSGFPITSYKDILYGDNLEDTPEQYYKTYIYDDCSREIYQCGRMIQINNFMDYSLPCACMFTLEQAAFMRDFTENLRPDVLTEKRTPSAIAEISKNIAVYPSLTDGPVGITVNNNLSFNAQLLTIDGRILDQTYNAQDAHYFDLSSQAPGIYLVHVFTEGQMISYKIVKQ